MLPLHLSAPSAGALVVVAVGAHPDDIEIGAGGTLLTLASAQHQHQIRFHYLVLTGTVERQAEARHAAMEFLGPEDLTVELHDLPEGRLPVHWQEVKNIMEAVADRLAPNLVFAPSVFDAHQDHRTIAEIVPTVFRDALYLAYEIPKWDGDMWRPSVYVPLAPDTAIRKVELLRKCFPSQQHRDWWDDDVFLGLARLRGMECRARYAEAFESRKMVIAPI